MRTAGGVAVKSVFVSECVFAFSRVRFPMLGEQIKPLEPQDKSDRRNEGGRERRRRGERGGEERRGARHVHDVEGEEDGKGRLNQ